MVWPATLLNFVAGLCWIFQKEIRGSSDGASPEFGPGRRHTVWRVTGWAGTPQLPTRAVQRMMARLPGSQVIKSLRVGILEKGTSQRARGYNWGTS
ncbi:hypothetical protein LZ32DRAFT_13793 [Colletotrichum eremochloae]|nr:hypothetical protein LZ32DRAFT_13793 [Colletotrichum eremochloae]